MRLPQLDVFKLGRMMGEGLLAGHLSANKNEAINYSYSAETALRTVASVASSFASLNVRQQSISLRS